MEGRHQRRALATGGDVAAAEIGHHGNARQFRQAVWVAELPSERVRTLRGVPQGLSVAAHGGDIFRAHTTGLPHAMTGGGIDVCQLHIELPQRFQPRFAARQHFEQRSAQGGRVGRMQGAGQSQPAFVEVQHHGVDTVEAGAGHQAGEEGAQSIDLKGFIRRRRRCRPSRWPVRPAAGPYAGGNLGAGVPEWADCLPSSAWLGSGAHR